jgi:ribonuclease P protein component
MAPGSSTGLTRLGITVTRKVGNAVVRNRAKRLVRETFRTMVERLPSNIDMVVIVRKALHRLSADDVRSEWANVEHLLLRRAPSRGTA